jgi:hypothetical protein
VTATLRSSSLGNSRPQDFVLQHFVEGRAVMRRYQPEDIFEAAGARG